MSKEPGAKRRTGTEPKGGALSSVELVRVHEKHWLLTIENTTHDQRVLQ